jgi:alpha-L-rhamnosidase
MKKSITRISPIISCALFFSFIPVGIADGALNAGQLTCDGWENPLGVDRATPMLSWKLQGKGRAERQTAYRILVASSASLLERDQGDLWDSGKVESSQTQRVPYSGKALGTSQQCYWKVRSWDRSGQPGAWSSPATWTMGVLRPEDWGGAKWVGGAPVQESKADAGWSCWVFIRSRARPL